MLDFGTSLVIFDWNGTLQDDAPATYEASPKAILSRYGLPVVSFDDWRNWPNHHDWMGNLRNLGVPGTVTRAELNAIYAEAIAKLPPAPLFPDARSTLWSLASVGIRLALVSGLGSSLLDADLDRHGLRPFFEHVEGGARRKDQVFARLVAQMGVLRESVVCVGDISDDAKAAEAVGLRAAVIPRGYQHRESIAAFLPGLPKTRLLETLADLLG